MKILKEIIKIPQKIVEGTLLSIVYFFGIGLTYLNYKIFKKKLFELRKKKSYWSSYIEDNKNYRMY
jgi:hypothetical protein